LLGLKHLFTLNKYFWKYRNRFFIGMLFIIAANYFAVLAPEITGYLVSKVQQQISNTSLHATPRYHDAFVQWIISQVENFNINAGSVVAVFCIIILLMAVLRGILMFFMRQTIIVMSRYIEFDQKNEVFGHYQQLDLNFYKTHSTGDLMNRITEDVSRVRMYSGPAIMYLVNLVALIGFCLVNMLRKDVHLTLLVLAPLPILAVTIYAVNTIINKKSEKVQSLLSDLTTNAQESYSGIRVIQSFVQEKAMLGFFAKNSEDYRKNAISLAKVEAIYFPSMALMIGLSTLITILIGSQMALADPTKVGLIVEFVIYINMLTFPVSSIGWVASMIQRAAASQKRLNEFLHTTPTIQDEKKQAGKLEEPAIIEFNNINFTYPHTGIHALKDFDLKIKKGEKVLVLGRTGSGKSTIAQLLLRFYDPQTGVVAVNGRSVKDYSLKDLREKISYVPQDVFLFSDSIEKNIGFGLNTSSSRESVQQAAKLASIHNEILTLNKGYDTIVGERGVTLSGGQKQRISIARAIMKNSQVLVFDDCLSAVDAKTEHEITHNLFDGLEQKTAIFISHRIFTAMQFDQVLFIENGTIIEQGTHEQLLASKGSYAELYARQNSRQQ
jgi:ATP-binding cassette subfamily B multidrug efflux pump